MKEVGGPAAEPTAAAGRGPADVMAAASHVHVLLVDDNEAWIRSVADVLEHQRDWFSVHQATDLATARELFGTREMDCVVCDYQLERGSGLDLLADVREIDPDRPFILITGAGNEDVASDAIGKQVTDYIPKRSLRDGELLARRIDAAVRSYRRGRALVRERESKNAMLEIVRATTSRDDLAEAFCRHLVNQRGYACTWIGMYDRSRGVVPTWIAGEESYAADAIGSGIDPENGTEPGLVALDRREPYVVAPIEMADSPATTSDARLPAAGDGRAGRARDGIDSWRKLARERGFRSAAAVPIEHEGTLLGVLAVYSTDPSAITDHERKLLRENCRTIGYALRSVEWKESLLSGTDVTVEFEIRDPEAPLVALVDRLPSGTSLRVLTSAYRDEQLLYVAEITGADGESVRSAAQTVESIRSVDVPDTAASGRCELLVTTPTPETVLADAGAKVVETVVDHGRARVTVVHRKTDGIGEFESALGDVYGDVSIRSVTSKRTEDDQLDRTNVMDSLTDKQREAIEMAYFGGYFQRPRENNTTEIAEKLGISRATFTQHLRAAERKLLTRMLDRND